MNQNFYNNKFTIITKEKIVDWNILENFDLWYGPIEEVCFKIKKFELDNDTFYNGHIIINDISILHKINFKALTKLNLTENCIFTQNVEHGGTVQECILDENIIVCNSFNLPVIANNSRTQNSLYADCWSHRIKIKKLKFNLL